MAIRNLLAEGRDDSRTSEENNFDDLGNEIFNRARDGWPRFSLTHSSVAGLGSAQPKGGHADVIPIASELVPYLERALAVSASELVFPGEDGKMMRPDVALENVLRRAMGRAGLVTGWMHVCRKKGRTHRERHPDAVLRRCPTHASKLWPELEVRPIRFHDMRHTTASLLIQAGASPAAVQRILRHHDPRLTMNVYGHLAPGFLRDEVDRLRFGVHPEPMELEQEALPDAANAEGFAASLLQAGRETQKGLGQQGSKPPDIRALLQARSTGLEGLDRG